MKLYQGSNVIITDINLEKCRPYKENVKRKSRYISIYVTRI
jgi:hypothetical protein